MPEAGKNGKIMTEMYFYIRLDGQQGGPIERKDFAKHGICATTPVWREGMADWEEARRVPELSAGFSATGEWTDELPAERTAPAAEDALPLASEAEAPITEGMVSVSEDARLVSEEGIAAIKDDAPATADTAVASALTAPTEASPQAFPAENETPPAWEEPAPQRAEAPNVTAVPTAGASPTYAAESLPQWEEEMKHDKLESLGTLKWLNILFAVSALILSVGISLAFLALPFAIIAANNAHQAQKHARQMTYDFLAEEHRNVRRWTWFTLAALVASIVLSVFMMALLPALFE